MKPEMFINFDGNCREALEFYAKVFKSEIGEVMTYGDAPSDPNYPLNEADRNKICYAGMPVGGMVLMFSDSPTGVERSCPHALMNNLKKQQEASGLGEQIHPGRFDQEISRSWTITVVHPGLYLYHT